MLGQHCDATFFQDVKGLVAVIARSEVASSNVLTNPLAFGCPFGLMSI